MAPESAASVPIDKDESTTKEVECEHGVRVGEKCTPCDAVEPMLSFDGAQSFADIDQWREGRDARVNVMILTDQFEAVSRNILADDDLSMAEKVGKIQAALDEMKERVDDPEATKDIDISTDSRGPRWWRKIRGTIGRDETKPDRLTAAKDRREIGMTPPSGSFTLKEHEDGSLWWMAVYSNGARDKDKEILTSKAHEEFAEYCAKTAEYPELWAWHTPGTRFGETKELAEINGFAVAVGTIDEGKEQIARNLEAMDLEMSHGFRYDGSDKSSDGIFSQYRSYEISVLPAGTAANPFTGWGLNPAEVVAMSKEMDPRRRQFFEDAGIDLTAVMEGLGAMRKALEDEGVEFKDAAPVLVAELFGVEAPDGGDGDGDGDEGGDDNKSGDPLAEVLLALKEGQDDIFERLKTTEDKLETLGQSKVDGIRDLFRGKGNLAITPPSEDPENVADGRSADMRKRKENDDDVPEGTEPHLAPYLANLNKGA